MVEQLVVACFNERREADRVLLDLLQLEQAHLAHLNDAVVVIKRPDGSLKVKAYHDLVEPVTELGNELWGGIISGVVFHRSLGIHQDWFDGQFLAAVEEAMVPDSSALFVLLPEADLEPVEAALAQHNGSIFKTALPDATYNQMQQAITQADA